jgi:CheY-like chemotaxis protein
MKIEEQANRGPYILYADDDLDDQAFLSEMLRKVNHNIQTLCFDNGLELVQHLEALPVGALLPACVILDLNMPVWDGMQTLKVLKTHSQYADIPVFIFSTSTSERDTHLAESIGAVAYITKPYAQNDLMKICQEFAEYAIIEPRYKSAQFLTPREQRDITANKN